MNLGRDGVEIDGIGVDVDFACLDGAGVHSLLIDGHSHRLLARRESKGRWGLHVAGRRFQAEVLDERTRAIRDITTAQAGPVGPSPVRAPMPGLIVRVEVSVNDIVTPGQGVAIVEAMKMETEIRSQTSGQVVVVNVGVGDAVKVGDSLMALA